jgi:hypothetical protein
MTGKTKPKTMIMTSVVPNVRTVFCVKPIGKKTKQKPKRKTLTEWIKAHRMRLTELLIQREEYQISNQKMYAVIRQWEKA